MNKEAYTYTGNMPSGNSCTWYFDENKRTAFGTDTEAKFWTKYPSIGDRIVYWKSGRFNEIIERVFINDEMVFERNEETIRIMAEEEKKYSDWITSQIRTKFCLENMKQELQKQIDQFRVDLQLIESLINRINKG